MKKITKDEAGASKLPIKDALATRGSTTGNPTGLKPKSKSAPKKKAK